MLYGRRGQTPTVFCGFSQILSDEEINKEFPNQVHNAIKLYVEWYQFNFDNPKFKDIRVRKALAMSVDKKSMIKVLIHF
jgi:ABC-type oligopeptide transport system substrate-binding subunit